MAKHEPRPCPCCGASATVTYGHGPAGKYANIRCDCGMQTRPVLCDDEKKGAEQACAIWNARSEQ